MILPIYQIPKCTEEHKNTAKIHFQQNTLFREYYRPWHQLHMHDSKAQFQCVNVRAQTWFRTLEKKTCSTNLYFYAWFRKDSRKTPNACGIEDSRGYLNNLTFSKSTCFILFGLLLVEARMSLKR